MGDVRCPTDTARLFFKVLPDGSLEVACKDCRNRLRRDDPSVVLVLHVYSPAGELAATHPLRLIPATNPG
jgi:hypothetical protein